MIILHFVAVLRKIYLRSFENTNFLKRLTCGSDRLDGIKMDEPHVRI